MRVFGPEEVVILHVSRQLVRSKTVWDRWIGVP